MAAKRRATSLAQPEPKRAAAEPPQEPQMDVEAVVSLLRLPQGVQVATDFANTRATQQQIQAYAKLSGPNWTFYVQSLEVVIGRSAVDCFDQVDIDLGPSKIVSRRHAILRYNLDSRNWELEVVGRNGIRVNCQSHKEGSVVLESGNIVDIGGVQMMFVLPDVLPQVNKTILQNLILRRNGAMSPTKSEVSPVPSPSPSPVHAPALISGGPQSANEPYKNMQITLQAQPSAVPLPAQTAQTQLAAPRGAPKLLDQDLSLESAKDIKPPFSYATMISQAILSTEDSSMSLADIYLWISSHYSYYRYSKPGWQNSIRHNLSLNKAFEKVPRKENEPGKGSKWQITSKYREEFIRKANAGKLIKGRSQLQFRVQAPKKDAVSGPQGAQVGAQAAQTGSLGAPTGAQVGSLEAPHGAPQAQHGAQHLQGQSIPATAYAQPQSHPPAQSRHPAPQHPAPQHHQQQKQPHAHAQPGSPLKPSLPPASTIAPVPLSPQKYEEEPLLPQPLNHSPARTPWLSRFAPRLGADDDKPYLEFLEGEYHSNSPANISQLEAYTPERGAKMTPMKGSPALWKYMHMNGTPLKDDSPVRVKK